MSDKRSQLLGYFRSFARLSEAGPLRSSLFRMPRIEEQGIKSLHGRKLSETTRLLPLPSYANRGAPERLSDAAASATRKLMFGKTPLGEWQETLVFVDDRVSRDSKNKRYRIHRSAADQWRPGLPINHSAASADDWFLKKLLPRISIGGEYKHSSAIVGSPGCGKSTLLKYLILTKSKEIRDEKIVFSRFEFLKFWNNWRSAEPSLVDAVSRYLSFINLRDLISHHFLEFEDGIPSRFRFELTGPKRLNNKIDSVCGNARELGRLTGYDLTGGNDLLVRNVLRSAEFGNELLMAGVRGLPHRLRVLLIGVLSIDLTLVTIFDGLDSVRIEDAFEKTSQFEAVKSIISTRRVITHYRDLVEAGISVNVDSITVMRTNTAALINFDAEYSKTDTQFSDYFELSSVNPKAALTSAALRSAKYLDEFREQSAGNIDKYVFDLMTILKRTLIAIARGHGARLTARLVFGLFDGNLRELFSFLEHVINWQTKEMLSGGYLESDDYMGNNVPRLVHALASWRGNELLRRKSYRIVELLMFREGDTFENAVTVKWTKDVLLSEGGKPATILLENNRFTGRVDNIFNYLPANPQTKVDQHGLLEKIRILQLCENKNLTIFEISERLKGNFGYISGNLRVVVQFLLKTDFLSASVLTRDSESVVLLKTTNRGLLCLKMLIFNLSYVEHVFHKTLLPECLVKEINDRPRSADLASWVTNSVRNAFIFLSYVSFVENHRAGGKAVPPEFRIAEKMRVGISSALERMTSGGSAEPARLFPTGGSPIMIDIVCNKSALEINKLVAKWTSEKILAPS